MSYTSTQAMLDQAIIMRTLMTATQGEKLAETLRKAGPQFRTTVLNDSISRLIDAWEGLPYANEDDPVTTPDNVAWLHYYTPTEDWFTTRRFFTVRNCQVAGPTTFYAARIAGTRDIEPMYGHTKLDEIKSRNARLDLFWTPKPVDDAIREL